MRGNISLGVVLVFSVGIFGLSAGVAWSAETFIWTQVATEGLWSDTGNWDANGPANGDGNTADFSTLDIGADNTVHLDASVTIGNLIFDDNNKSWILDNNGNATNILTLAGTTPTIEVKRRQATIIAVIDGTSGLTKSGTGTLWLSGTNTYTGGTVIDGGGQVRINSDAGLGDTSGAVTVNNSFTLYSSSNITLNRDFALGSGTIMSFDIGSNNQDRTIAGAVTGEGGIYVTATLGLKLTSTGNTFTGPISMGSGIYAGRFDVNSIGDAPGAGTIQIGSANGYGAGRFEYMSGAITPLVLDYRQIDVASPGGAAYLINNAGDANTITVNTDVLSTPAGNKHLKLGGSNTADNEIAGAIGDGGGVVRVTKQDGGTWILSGDNTYSGGTTVTAGMLIVDSATAIGTGSLALPSASSTNLTLNYDYTVDSGAFYINGEQQPNGTYTSTGAGSGWLAGASTLTVGSANWYWDLNGTDAGAGDPAGTWNAVDANWNATSDGTGTPVAWTPGDTATFAAGTDATGTYTVTVSGTQDIGGLTFEQGDVTLSGGGLHMTSDSTVWVGTGLTATLNSPISQDTTGRQLIKAGAGTLDLSVANSHSDTLVSGGIVNADVADSLGTGSVTVTGGALNINAAQSFTGETVVSGGTLQLSNTDAIASSSGLSLAGGSVTLTTDLNLKSLTFAGTANETISGQTLNFAPGGSITSSVANVEPTITSAITGSPSVSVPVRNSGKKYWQPGNYSLYQGLIFAPTSGTVKLGTAHLDSGLWLGGTTTGNEIGQITQMSQQGCLYKKDSGTWTVNGDVNVGIAAVDGGTLIINGTLTADYAGMLPIFSGGRLGGNLTYLKTDARSGDFIVKSGGIMAPGDPTIDDGIGTITISWGTNSNDVRTTTFEDGSIYEWQVGADGLDGNATTDTVHILKTTKARALTIGNMKLKIFDAGGSVTSTDQLPVFTYDDGVTIDMDGFGDTIDNFDISELGGGWKADSLSLVDGGEGIIYLTGLANSLVGDANGDGVVDSADYIMVKTHFGGAPAVGTEGSGGDFDGDGTVDWDDLQLLQTALNTSAGDGADTIPEPATMGLLAVGGMALLRRRRRA